MIIKKPIIVILLLLTFINLLFTQTLETDSITVEQVESIKTKAVADANASPDGDALFYGCLGAIGIYIAISYVPSPPYENYLNYNQIEQTIYRQSYVERIKKRRMNTSLTGCIISFAGLMAIYTALLISLEESNY